MRLQPRPKDLVVDINNCKRPGQAVDANVSKLYTIHKDQACQREVITEDQACQAEDLKELRDLKDEIATLKKEIESLRKSISEANTKPKFDVFDYKHSEDISFYTGFPNFDTLLLCFDMLQEKAANLCYNDNGTTNFDPHLILNIKSPEVRGRSLSVAF